MRHPDRPETAEQRKKYNDAPAARARRLARAKTPEQRRLNENRRLKKKTGWSYETRDAAKAAQSNRCAICTRLTNFLCCDHEHVEPPVPRALLCRACNLSLGYYEKWQRSAGLVLIPYDAYLAKHSRATVPA